MGTALTGLQIGSTYNGLLKTTDNAVIDGSLRTITDGLGNDTALQVSTAAVKSAGTLEATGAVSAGGQITSTHTSQILAALAATTGAKYIRLQSTGGDVYLGTEQNGGGFFTGAGSYETVLYSPANNVYIRAPQISTNADLSVAGTGSFSGLVSVGGSTPASASATGVAGTITWDANYIYVCTATNTWKRAAIATW